MPSELKWIYGDDPWSSCDFNQPSNPVHRHRDGSWWFYDEVWVEEFGPFSSEEEANDHCVRYAKHIEDGETDYITHKGSVIVVTTEVHLSYGGYGHVLGVFEDRTKAVEAYPQLKPSWVPEGFDPRPCALSDDAEMIDWEVKREHKMLELGIPRCEMHEVTLNSECDINAGGYCE